MASCVLLYDLLLFFPFKKKKLDTVPLRPTLQPLGQCSPTYVVFITSWEIDGETVETVADVIFWAPKSLQVVPPAM